MEEYNPVPCLITTIENYEKRIPIAQANFKRAGKEKENHTDSGRCHRGVKDVRRSL